MCNILLIIVTDVGFAVGGDSGINYLVLQVHYATVDSFKGKVTNIIYVLRDAAKGQLSAIFTG